MILMMVLCATPTLSLPFLKYSESQSVRVWTDRDWHTVCFDLQLIGAKDTNLWLDCSCNVSKDYTLLYIRSSSYSAWDGLTCSLSGIYKAQVWIMGRNNVVTSVSWIKYCTRHTRHDENRKGAKKLPSIIPSQIVVLNQTSDTEMAQGKKSFHESLKPDSQWCRSSLASWSFTIHRLL